MLTEFILGQVALEIVVRVDGGLVGFTLGLLAIFGVFGLGLVLISSLGFGGLGCGSIAGLLRLLGLLARLEVRIVFGRHLLRIQVFLEQVLDQATASWEIQNPGLLGLGRDGRPSGSRALLALLPSLGTLKL